MSVPERYTAVSVTNEAIDIDCDMKSSEEDSRKCGQHLYLDNNSCRYKRDDQQQQFTSQQSLMSVQAEDSNGAKRSMDACLQTVDQGNAVLNVVNCESRMETTIAAMTDADPTTSQNLNSEKNHRNREKPQAEWEMMSDDEGGRYSAPGATGLEYQKYIQEELQRNAPNNNEMDQTKETFNRNENFNKNINNGIVQVDLLKITTEELYNLLKEYGILQDKYHTVLLLPKESKREVTAGGRDGSAYVLRCLKIWYELPSDVLFSAMSLVDRFLDRMTVRPKHMACMSVASFYLAIKQLNLKSVPADDLVTISQCGCTAGDLERMANVIANKLGVQMGHSPVTSLTCLRIYYALFHHLARDIGGDFYKFYQKYIKIEELENRLEVLLCDVRTTTVQPSTLALVLISLHLDFHIKASYTLGRPELKLVFEYILFLQKLINVPDRTFTCGFSVVSDILRHYNGQNKQPYKQRLVWKLSSRTLRLLRPTTRFSSVLPTIQEGISNNLDEACRFRTDSSSSEEEEDWPTSPIIPIFEPC